MAANQPDATPSDISRRAFLRTTLAAGAVAPVALAARGAGRAWPGDPEEGRHAARRLLHRGRHDGSAPLGQQDRPAGLPQHLRAAGRRSTPSSASSPAWPSRGSSRIRRRSSSSSAAGVKFHDGTDFNAEAAKFNFNRMKTEPKSVRKGEVANIDSVDVVDAYTIKLNLKRPDAALLATLTDRAGMMVSPKVVQERGAELERNAKGAGTGPFEFVEWVKDDHLADQAQRRLLEQAGRPLSRPRSATGRSPTTRSSCRACRPARST